jgi:hypothetical protein
MKKIIILAAFILSATILIFMSGCGGGSSNGSSNKISISNIIVPNAPTSDGGTISIFADVTGNNITIIYASIVGPSSVEETVNMVAYSGDTYTANYDVEPNVTEKDILYSVEIVVIDSKGKKTNSSTVFFSVPASSGPPGPPPNP